MAIDDIPTLNACLNAVATVLITTGYFFIRAKNQRAHRACMVSALVASTLFLAGYVTHKILVHGMHTPFGGTGALRTVYYTMLISHILLAFIIVPLVLRTFFLAVKGDFTRHRQWAKWTFPIWMYVSVTGVLIYMATRHWYPAVA